MQEHCLLFLATLNAGMNAVRYTLPNATLSTEHLRIADIFMSFFDKPYNLSAFNGLRHSKHTKFLPNYKIKLK